MGSQTIPPVPPGLSRYPRAIEKWNALWGVLEQTRVNPALHGDIVAQYCIYYSDMRDALEKMERGKLVAEKKTTGIGDKATTTIEKLSISPFQGVFDRAVQQMERLGRMIGLDPMNPLEATRTFADYAAIMYDDEGDDADGDGTAGDDAGDSGEPDSSDNSGPGNGTAVGGEVEGSVSARGVLDT